MIRNYHIENLIGEGGMGVVYKATDQTLERTVAIKILHNHLVRDPVFYERFRNEAILLARLNHPNVTTLYNFSTEREQSFMVMEYVEGVTLEQLLKKEKVLSAEAVVRIISAAAKGLQHAHDKGIFHRDIKPSNIMISEKGEVKLMDFGIAKLKGSTSLTRVGSIIGTLEYMAPELLSGSTPSVASDLYAMGIVMYELLTGKLPFEGHTEASLIHRIIHQKPLPLRTYTTGVPRELESILESLLRKNPERRIGSALELKQLLEKVPLARAVEKAPVQKIYLKTVETARKVSKTVLQHGRTLPRWLNTPEGYIMAGGLLIASLILILGLRSFEEESQTSLAESAPTEQVPLSGMTTESPSESFPVEPSRSPVEASKPAENTRESSPQKKAEVVKEEKTRAEKVQEPPPSPKVQEEKQPETEEKKEDHTYIPAEIEVKEKALEKTVFLENMNVALVLDETVSSDDPATKGRVISFKVFQDVFAGGVKVVSAGSTGSGRVLKARSSGSGKSFLEIRPETVRAVNGETLKLKSPPLGRSGSTTDPVIFSKGTRISPDPRIVNKSIKLQI